LLNQINKSNVKRLVPIWTTSLANDAGDLTQPSIYNGVMCVVNGNWTVALDVATGQDDLIGGAVWCPCRQARPSNPFPVPQLEKA
jgi:hypothetical protein